MNRLIRRISFQLFVSAISVVDGGEVVKKIIPPARFFARFLNFTKTDF
jgi:hypothetical protein